VNDSLFATLYKYSTGQDKNEKKENYLTQCFVFILNRMLRHDKPAALELLGVLCGDDSLFSDDESPSIEPHKRIPGTRYTPDITIKGHNAKVFIEVKWNKRVDDAEEEKLREYKRRLPNRTKVQHRKLVLLTKFHEATSVPHNKTRWTDIERKLDSLDVWCEVNKYILNEFKKYLKEEGMLQFEKVDDVYSDGLRAFFNMWKMAKLVTETALGQDCKEYILPEFVGWQTKDKAFLTGIYFEDPDKLWFEFDTGRSRKRIKDERALNIDGVKPEAYPNRGYRGKTWYSWPRQLDNYFFSLEKEQQFEEIHKFFERCRDAINKASSIAKK